MEPFIETGGDMFITTSCTVQDKKIREYQGVISSNVTMGRNVGKDFAAGLRDFFGGRSRSWEKSLQEGQKKALEELVEKAEKEGADGLVGVRLEDEAVGNGNMMNIKATGTAVEIE